MLFELAALPSGPQFSTIDFCAWTDTFVPAQKSLPHPLFDPKARYYFLALLLIFRYVY